MSVISAAQGRLSRFVLPIPFAADQIAVLRVAYGDESPRTSLMVHFLPWLFLSESLELDYSLVRVFGGMADPRSAFSLRQFNQRLYERKRPFLIQATAHTFGGWNKEIMIV